MLAFLCPLPLAPSPILPSAIYSFTISFLLLSNSPHNSAETLPEACVSHGSFSPFVPVCGQKTFALLRVRGYSMKKVLLVVRRCAALALETSSGRWALSALAGRAFSFAQRPRVPCYDLTVQKRRKAEREGAACRRPALELAPSWPRPF